MMRKSSLVSQSKNLNHNEGPNSSFHDQGLEIYVSFLHMKKYQEGGKSLVSQFRLPPRVLLGIPHTQHAGCLSILAINTPFAFLPKVGIIPETRNFKRKSVSFAKIQYDRILDVPVAAYALRVIRG